MRRVLAAATFALALGGTCRAAGFSFPPSFTPSELTDLVEAVGDVITFPNLGTAAAGGVTGFQVLAAAGGPRVDTGAGWYTGAVNASTAAGVLYGTRVIARKGLPGNVDVGAQLGTVAGQRFWGAEARWALWEGGTLTPSAALRASYSRLTGAPFELDVTEAQLVVSKGFLAVSPYAAVGYRRVSASATFGEPAPVSYSVGANRATAALGVRLALLPFVHLVGEARRGARTGFFVGVGVGVGP